MSEFTPLPIFSIWVKIILTRGIKGDIPGTRVLVLWLAISRATNSKYYISLLRVVLRE